MHLNSRAPPHRSPSNRPMPTLARNGSEVASESSAATQNSSGSSPAHPTSGILRETTLFLERAFSKSVPPLCTLRTHLTCCHSNESPSSCGAYPKGMLDQNVDFQKLESHRFHRNALTSPIEK